MSKQDFYINNDKKIIYYNEIATNKEVDDYYNKMPKGWTIKRMFGFYSKTKPL